MRLIETRYRTVIYDFAMIIGPARVHNAAHSELREPAGHDPRKARASFRPLEVVFKERGDIQHASALPEGVVFALMTNVVG